MNHVTFTFSRFFHFSSILFNLYIYEGKKTVSYNLNSILCDKMVNIIRVRRECRFLEANLFLIGISLAWDENDDHHLSATITGPSNTPYEGGVFIIDINLPDSYPYAPPAMRCLTKVWHPNIGQNGAVSLSCLKEGGWSCAMTLETALTALQVLLSTPDLSDPQDAQILNQYLNDNSKFIRKARRWTQTYAVSHDDNPATREGRSARLPSRLDDFML